METLTSRLPLTIIVIEDNPVDVYLIRWVLNAHGLAHELHVIDNDDHAMDYVNRLAHEERRRSPTLMLLDLNLPQRDGREILQRVKSIPHGSDIRVVIVTSSSNPTDRRETLALGADAYFEKPTHLNEFMQLGDLIKNLAFGNPPHPYSRTSLLPHVSADPCNHHHQPMCTRYVAPAHVENFDIQIRRQSMRHMRRPNPLPSMRSLSLACSPYAIQRQGGA